MKKVNSVHLGGKMFQIEDDAYAYLNNALSGQWKKQEFEVKIAEGLERKLSPGKSVINYPDVVDVLYSLGCSASDYQSYNPFQRDKRLYRQPNNKTIAGICSGIGEYFEIDPVIVRVLFVIAFFLGTMGFWLYIILWIIIPNDSQRLNAQSW